MNGNHGTSTYTIHVEHLHVVEARSPEEAWVIYAAQKTESEHSPERSEFMTDENGEAC